ncbi:TetR family transcriptional regulator [Actinosynnema sp. NPDC020468]|uniref:TetR family transcriptional regulator n=1 Tax=Actinosynnema sp. NPDC020468 TaxID=3154488 RepID=UPI0034027BE0
MTGGLRDRKKRQTRDALARAAVTLVDARGFDQVTVDDIAAEAGVSARTFFNYFAGKEEAVVGPDPEAGPRLRALVAAQPASMSTCEAVKVAFLAEIAGEVDVDRELWLARLRIVMAHPEMLVRAFVGSQAAEKFLVEAIAERTGLATTDTYPQVLAAAAGAAFRCAVTRWATANRPLDVLAAEALDLLAVGLADPPRTST